MKNVAGSQTFTCMNTYSYYYNIVPTPTNYYVLPPLVSGPTPHKTQVSELNSDIMGEYQRTLWPLSSPPQRVHLSASATNPLQICCK